MTTETKEVEFYLCIDQNGEFIVDKFAENIAIRYAEEVTDQVAAPATSHRVFHFKFVVPLPSPTVVAATVPDTDGLVTVVVS